MTQIVKLIDASRLREKGWVEREIMVPQKIYEKDGHTLSPTLHGWIYDKKKHVQFFEDLNDNPPKE
jgi:hypothetical protein